MSVKHFLRINETLEPQCLYEFEAGSEKVSAKTISSWSDLASIKAPITIILSAKLVLQKTVQIPSKKEEVLRQSIPFALEEEIADDLSENHFAYQLLSENTYMVSIVKKNVLEHLNEQISQQSLDVKEMYSEVFTCPAEAKQLNIVIDAEKAIVREGHLGSSLNIKTLNSYLKLSKAERVNVYSASQDIPFDNEVANLNLINDLKSFEIGVLESANKVNLLQGDYLNRSEKTKTAFAWKRVLLLSLVLFGSWLGIHLYKVLSLNAQIAELRNQQESLFVKLIPQANQTELNNPYSAFLSRLKLNNQAQNAQSDDFIKALRALGESVLNHSRIEIRSLRLRDKEIEILLTAPDSQSLNDFQSALQDNSYNMRVRTGTRSLATDGLNAVLVMEIL